MRINFKWFFVLAFLFAGVTEGATYTLPNGPLPSNCSNSGQTVTCSSLNLNWNDNVTIQGSGLVTLNINGTANFNNAKVNVDGNPNKLTIEVIGALTLDYKGEIVGNISAKSANLGGENSIDGNIFLTEELQATGNNMFFSGNISAGNVNLGEKASVGGFINANTINAGTKLTVASNIQATTITLGNDSYIGGSVSTDSITTGTKASIANGIQATTIVLGKDSSVGGPINTDSLTTGTSVNITGDITANTVNLKDKNIIIGNIIATLSLTTDNDTKVTGDITAPTITLGSKNTLNGNAEADLIKILPDNSTVNGTLTATGNIDLGSGATITNSISAGGNITTDSPVTLTGNIDADGDFTLASGSTVIGDVYGKTITLIDSNAKIDGNAVAVDTISIGWAGKITGDATAHTIDNTSNNNDNTVEGEIYCTNEPNFKNRVCKTSPPQPTGPSGITSCSAEFSKMLDSGVIGDASFEYGDKATINNIEITGSNGNTPTPKGVVDTVPTTFPALNPATFPAFSTGSTNIKNETNIPPGSYDEIKSTNNSTSTQGGTYYIDEVKVVENNKLYLAAGQYYINTLELEERAKLTLGSGDYFIKTVDLDENAEIIIKPGASVRIYIKDKFDTDENAKINHSNGSVASLSIFLYSDADLELGDKSKFTGFIYSPFSNTEIELDDKVHFEGGIISAGEVELEDKVKITFHEEDTYEEILEAAGCNAVPPPPHHYRIVLPQQELVSCYAAPVAVKACANADCSSLYANTVQGTLKSDAASAAWNGTNSNVAAFTFATGESTYGLSLVPGGNAEIAINNMDPVAANTPQCVDASGSATSCEILFKTAGLLVSAPSPFAGVDTLVTISALETDIDTGECMARATGDQNVRLGMECSNPSNCISGQKFTVTDNAGEQQFTLFDYGIDDTSISLSFDPTGTATFSANYTDVGQIRIHAALDLDEEPNDDEPGINDPEITLSGTGSYVVRPHTLTVQGLDDDGNPVVATTDTGPGYKAAGEKFNLAIQSLNAQGNPTPNFGKETTPAKGSVTFQSVVFPTNGYGGQNDLDLTGLSLSSQQNLPGALLYEGAIWNEAGTVNLTAALKDNLYLGAGDAANKPPSPVGRFYPHHFILSSSSVRNSCSAGDFSYMGEPNIAINLEVHAVNKTDGLLTNYGNGDSTGTGHYVGSATVALNQLGYPLLERLNPTFNEAWNKGKLIEDLTTVTFARPASTTPDGPFDNLDVYIQMQDAEDGRSFTGSNSEKLDGPLNLKYGRMVLESVSGPEDQNLNVVLNTEFWNGTGFVINSADNCTKFDPAELAITPSNNPNNIVTVAGLTPDVVHNGAVQPGDLYWQAPTSGTFPGEFGFEYNAPEWLRFDWGRLADPNGTNQNPQATAGFGLYRGNDRIIFSLERNF